MIVSVTHLVNRTKLILLSCFALLLLTGCGEQQREQVYLNGPTMGTSYNIKFINKDGLPKQDVIHAEIDKRLELVNDQKIGRAHV